MSQLKCATLETCNQLHAPLVEATMTFMLVAVVAATVGFYAYRDYRRRRRQAKHTKR